MRAETKRALFLVVGQVWCSTEDLLLIENCWNLSEVHSRPSARAGDVKGRLVTKLLILLGCNCGINMKYH